MIHLTFKTKVCQECNGKREIILHPLVYVDRFTQQEYSSKEYSPFSLEWRGYIIKEQLPSNNYDFKKVICTRCNGSGQEHHMNELIFTDPIQYVFDEGDNRLNWL